MKQLSALIFIVFLLFAISACKKNSSNTDLTDKGFIVVQAAECNFGTPSITNLPVGELYIDFDSPTFIPAPNTWYRAANPGVPCGTCDALFRYKTGSDVTPKDAPITFGADKNVVLAPTNLCN